MRINFLLFALVIGLSTCTESGKKDRTQSEKPKQNVKVPTFDADSAFYFVRKQIDFGPRIPNSISHREAAKYLVETLTRYGARVSVQETEVKAFDGSTLSLKNIIASYSPQKQKRILLAAHWDTRPFADKDQEAPSARFDGANDGASGVAVLLEIARLFASNPPEAGVDIILFDAEDYGEKINTNGPPLPPNFQSWWCLGSQYWSKNKHTPGYAPAYGILLDMVGAENAQFHKEGYSVEFASTITDRIWNTADQLGYSHFFVKRNQEAVIDDHLFVNTIAKIPMVNIVNYDAELGFFGDFHHTRKDNLQLISPKTLKAVGQTVLTVLYHEEE